MLEFNPYFRANPSKLLKSSIFDAIRDPVLEADPTRPVEMIEDERESYDYEELVPLNMDINTILHRI